VVTGCAHSTIRPDMMQRAFRYGPLAEEDLPVNEDRCFCDVRPSASQNAAGHKRVPPLANKSEERPKGDRTNTYVGT
jgi:hypothetical protein